MDPIIINSGLIRGEARVAVWEFVNVPGDIMPAGALGEYYDTGTVFDSKPVYKHLTAEFHQWRSNSPVPTLWSLGPSVGTMYWEREDFSAEGVYLDASAEATGDGTFQEL